MSTPDLRRPQIALLKFEKATLAAATVLGTIGVTAAAHADETLDGAASAALADLTNAQLMVAEKASELHSLLEAKAGAVGGRLLAEGGGPKDNVAEMVKLALGL